MCVLVLLAEHCHLHRKITFLNNQKIISFLSRLVQQQVFVAALEFGSTVQGKIPVEPVRVDGTVWATSGLVDQAQEVCGKSFISRHILIHLFSCPVRRQV